MKQNYRHTNERVQESNVQKSLFASKMNQNDDFVIGFDSKTIKNSPKMNLKQAAKSA